MHNSLRTWDSFITVQYNNKLQNRFEKFGLLDKQTTLRTDSKWNYTQRTDIPYIYNAS